MTRLHTLVGALMLALPLGAAAGPGEGFFEFTTTPAAHPEWAAAEGGPGILVFEGLEVADGYYRLNGREVSRVVGGQTTSLPALPLEPSRPAAALLGDRLYVADGARLFHLDPAAPDPVWEEASGPPEGAGSAPLLVAHGGRLYLSGTGEGGVGRQSYDPLLDEWTTLPPATVDLRGMVATPCGNDHLLFFDARAANDRILAHHLITGTWFEMGPLPQPVRPVGAASNGLEFTLFSPEVTVAGEAVLRPTKYGWVDHSVVAVLVLLLIGSGVFFARRERSSGDYFRAGKRIPWWAAGLSLFATGASAISLMAMPGKAFAENWIYFSISIFTVLIQIPLFLLVYIPVARRLEISTANEYLERRFNLAARLLGFVCFTLYQSLGRMAAILLLPSLAISAISGMPMEYSILIMGVVTTLFVTMGGLEAVIWTDAIQAIIMLVAVLGCCLYAAFALDLSWPAAMQILAEGDKLRMFDWRLDWREPVVIVLILNTFGFVLGWIGDQNFVQRVQCTPDEKTARKAVYAQLAVAVPLNLVLFAFGTVLFLFYVTRPEELSPALKPDGVFPFFAAQNLPTGMAGFVVVALLASTISTVSSAMNSVANLGVEDVYRRFFPRATDHGCLVLGRILTFGLGVFGTVAALLLANMSSLQSIWDLFIMITGMVLAPVTGLFVLGIFSRRTNNFGALAGSLASIAANYYATFHMDVHPLVYLSIGVFSCIFVGYLASWLAPRSDRDLDGLTVYTLLKRKD